jgi:DNA-binding CsgD family transcriptional regulator
MATERARSRCKERLDRLVGAGLDPGTLRVEIIAELRRIIGFEHWCWPQLDPDALTIMDGAGNYDDIRAELPRYLVDEGRGGDINNAVVLARSRHPVGALSAATGGDLARSRRWREIYAAHGTGDELRTVTADQHGAWSLLDLFRASDDRPFSAPDAQLMQDVSGVLARGMRRVAIGPAESPNTTPAEAGVLLIGDDLRRRGSTRAADAWLAALSPAAHAFPAGIPPVVWGTVGALLGGGMPRARLRAADGAWAIVEAARLEGDERGITVTIRPAGGNDVLALLCRAYGISAREREVIGLLVEGLDTRAITERLVISRHTVQDHLKSVFAKVGVNSRRELVTGIFAQAA